MCPIHGFKFNEKQHPLSKAQNWGIYGFGKKAWFIQIFNML
jgi:hypothetical protein